MASLYVLAMTSCCVEPARVPVNGIDPPADLLSLLRMKLEEEMTSIRSHHARPVTSYYQVSLSMLGLCESEQPISQTYVNILIEAVKKNEFWFDTTAVTALALRCLELRSYKPIQPIKDTLTHLTADLYGARDEWGDSENIYSAGLAMQALIANDNHSWDSEGLRRNISAAIGNGKFNIPIAAAQMLPALLDKPYLDVMYVDCPVASGQQEAVVSELGTIHVVYEVVQPEICHHIELTVEVGATILDVMELAQTNNTQYFKFEKTRTVWGWMITAIGGTEAKSAQHTYWEFLVGNKPITVGVSSFHVQDGDDITARLAEY